uniref:Uncharacterized protein n=1 Tax=Pipistrellus kuhlii TaxID=59472 RepID=A0A7J7RHT4_PIPKU|nr:hypothetical protein mPipKuh1_010540 [Pipistrellus kuhlii]
MTPNTLQRAGRGRRDAYLAQVAAQARAAAAALPPRSAPGPFLLRSPPGHGRAVCVRGRGRDRWGGTRAPACGLRCGGDSGPISPHWGGGRGPPPGPACGERGQGACPTRGLDLGEHSDSLLYRGVWGAGTPSILGA